jgi:ABC-type polysaccharide transport system permease subunit
VGLHVPALDQPVQLPDPGAGLGAIPFLGAGGIYPSLANIAVWGGVGLNMIIIFTSLRGIPSTLYDAARAGPSHRLAGRTFRKLLEIFITISGARSGP